MPISLTPLIASAIQFKALILGIGLLIVIFPYPLRRFLAVVVILALLIVLVPASVPHLLAVWRSLVALLSFLLAGASGGAPF